MTVIFITFHRFNARLRFRPGFENSLMGRYGCDNSKKPDIFLASQKVLPVPGFPRHPALEERSQLWLSNYQQRHSWSVTTITCSCVRLPVFCAHSYE